MSVALPLISIFLQQVGEGGRRGAVRRVTTFRRNIRGSRFIALELKPGFPLTADGKRKCHSTIQFTWKPLKNTDLALNQESFETSIRVG